MYFPEEDAATARDESHAVIQEAKDAGVYVFGGGIEENVDPVMVAACRCSQELREFQFDPLS